MSTMPRTTGGDRRPWWKIALLCFGVWATLLLAALLLEQTTIGEVVFSHESSAMGYLVVQVLALLAALGACIMTFVRGSAKDRLIVVIPTLCLLLYALILIGGPG